MVIFRDPSFSSPYPLAAAMSLLDMRIDVDDFPRVSVGHRRSSSLTFTPFMIFDGYSRSSFSYSKLPEEPIKLSVLKLDGSCFEIEVMKSATVAELRLAVEAVFSHIPRKGPNKISWSHVWKHFCLTFVGQKLVIETDFIRDYGIGDGDQLQFIRHLSNNHVEKKKKRTTKQTSALEQHRISLSRLDNYQDEELMDNDNDRYDIENGRYQHFNYNYDNCFEQKESKWAFFLRRWFSYSRLPTREKIRSLKLKGFRSSRSMSCHLFGSCRSKLVQFCSQNQNSPRKTWRED